MTSHKFKVGQRVVFHAPRSLAPGIFTVLRILPANERAQTYRIKSLPQNVERVAEEGELTSLHEDPA